MAILDLDDLARNSNTTAPPCHAHAAPASNQRLRQAECKAGDPDPRHHADAEEEEDDELLLKGVRHLCERGGGGITRLPARYVLPPSDRPAAPDHRIGIAGAGGGSGSLIPVIDLARLRAAPPGGQERAAALAELDAACRDYGFFQVVGHGLADGAGGGIAMLDVARRFFDLPFGERARHMSLDIRAAVRYGTSFNQLNDGVLCWRDFLKLVCDDLGAVVPTWPEAPADLRYGGGVFVRAVVPAAVQGADGGGAGGARDRRRRRRRGPGGLRRRVADADGELLPGVPGAGAHAGDASPLRLRLPHRAPAGPGERPRGPPRRQVGPRRPAPRRARRQRRRPLRDVQQRALQERPAPCPRELVPVAHLGGVAAQPAAGEGDRAGAGAGRRREEPPDVHGHGLRHLPRLPQLRRGQAQVLPPDQEAHHRTTS
ncbi:unnamed protein product [Urochloa decumbens]|uniref:Non-haem dioxygenase N-terminal domain-containing protein n=1 Tax=Urochloa decumbens TaxID=240449 RepID=A0ABC9EZL0_9POAL